MNQTRSPKSTRNRSILFKLCGLLLISALSTAHASVIESGHSALWIDPDRTGEGWVLEMLSEDHALVYWYTYDDQGNQRWLQGIGAVASDEQGEYLDFSELYITRGGRFGPDFNPDDVEIEIVGDAVMRFSDCNHGSFSYSAFGQSQTIEIQRLTQTMAAGCAPINGVPGQPVRDYAGQSGTWFDPARDGEGFSMHWLSRDEALVTWYTYDDQGNQRWMVGNGLFVDGRIEFSMIHTTQGARFGTEFDPDDVELIEWGSLSMDLACLEGNAEFASVLPAFGSGSMDLSRLTVLDQPGCPWTRPKLTDLYDLTWKELPIGEDELISAASIADNGTVAGIRRSDTLTGAPVNITLLHPDAQSWQSISGETDGRVKISADSSQIQSRRTNGYAKTPIIWREETGWQPLPDLIYERSGVYGASPDFSVLVGSGSNPEDNRGFPWIWDAENGQRQLPLHDQFFSALPNAVSDDGTIVVGDAVELHLGDHGVGLLWSDTEAEPELLFSEQDGLLGAAQLCNQDCSVIAGYGLAGQFNPENRPWIKVQDGSFQFLGELPDSTQIIEGYIPRDISSDGSMIVGRYSVFGVSGELTTMGFIWTQSIGLVSVRSLIEKEDIEDNDWQRMNAISMSTTGDKILLVGAREGDTPDSRPHRAVILELSPISQ